LHLSQHKQALYDISFATGATHKDHLIDIDGGIGTLLVFASKGRRELPDNQIYLDGAVEQLSRQGSFLGQHVTELCVKLMLDSGLLPDGALQLVSGGMGDMLDHLGSQDVVSFTGSATTALKLRSSPHLLEQAVRFVAEQDSLNASVLGPDAAPGSPEFELFIKEVTREMTTKAGQKGAFVPPLLYHCADPDTGTHVHDVEAFGPVSTVMPYRDLEHAMALLNRGQGSLVASVITHDSDVARQVVLGSGAYHGRLYFNNRDSMKESTGHGSPLPHMVHGGPGRAGGGEELGGVRGVMHYMQRTAVQGSPDVLAAIGSRWVPGAREQQGPAHPFTRSFHELNIGETLHTESRTISLDDIEHFAEFTGDTFYAHMDAEAAARNPFFPGRVAHGYLLLSFAAGLFVQADEGPVLANTGLDNLRFMKPVEAGDSIKVRLSVKMSAFILDAVRTPIGRYGGGLSSVRADDLAALPIAELLKRNPGINFEQVDEPWAWRHVASRPETIDWRLPEAWRA